MTPAECRSPDPQEFWDRAQQLRTRAEAAGALHPIVTAPEAVTVEELRAVVRIPDPERLRRAPHPVTSPDPFLPPYEPELYLGDISPTHAVLLNKYPILARHLLLVTRRWAAQTALLDAADFTALATLLCARPALGFCNSGPEAGASQPHKHLQAVTLPLAPWDPPIPFGPWIEQALQNGKDTIRQFTFRHALVGLPSKILQRPDAGPRLENCYSRLLEHLHFDLDAQGRLPPYNLLVTAQWMLFVPRRRGTWDGIPVNALGYAGAFIARGPEQRARLAATGPLAMLASVGIPA